MAGPLEELADWDSQRVGDGRDRRGARVDAGPLSAGDRLTMQIAPLGDVGEAHTQRLPHALDTFHGMAISNANVITSQGRSRRPRAGRILLVVTTAYTPVFSNPVTKQAVPGARVAGGTGQLLLLGVSGVPLESNSCTVTVMGFLSMLVKGTAGIWPALVKAIAVVRTVAAPASGGLVSTSANVASAAAPTSIALLIVVAVSVNLWKSDQRLTRVVDPVALSFGHRG
jgi:hypothetical protein